MKDVSKLATCIHPLPGGCTALEGCRLVVIRLELARDRCRHGTARGSVNNPTMYGCAG